MNYYTDEILPVPRRRVFVLIDGTFVVQWEANQVQELLTGRYQVYEQARFGASITDWELKQLKDKGVVEHYDAELVYLCPLPNLSALSASQRAFYLNTGLEASEARRVEEALREKGLDSKYSVRRQTEFVIIRSANGTSFSTFDEAERAREFLATNVPSVCSGCVVAFVETVTS
jgi:thermostable 8-oxoguanine DNA glycosylase